MSSDTVLVEVSEGVATLTLNRPDRLNAFNDEMHEALREAIRTARRDKEVRALLLTGKGRAFSAGQDLSDRVREPGQPPHDLGAGLDRHYNPLVRTLRTLEMPVVAAVNGVAAGAGANIALACDIVLAARSAKFIEAFCKIGLVPDSGGSFTLPRRIGWARALGMAMLGEPVPAAQAEDWGLIWRCVEDDALLDEATALARHLATQPTKGLALMKRAFNASTVNDLDRQLDLERDLQRIAGRTEDYQEGVAAFFEKREPKFKGC